MLHLYTNQVSFQNNTKLLPAICGAACQQKAVYPQVQQSITNQIIDFFSKLFNTADFPARWHCGNWTDFHGWLYILSDITIATAYFAIPFFLIRLLIKRKDIPLNGVVILFLAFVFLCGLTHLIDAIIFWWPAYRLSAVLRFATAIVSVIAVYGLNQAFPMLLGLRSVRELKIEIEKRKKTEERLSASEFLLSEAGRIARVGGWELDIATGKRSWSKTVYDMLEIPTDYDSDEQDSLSYYPQPYRTLIEQGIKNALEQGSKWDLETLVITKKNKTFWARYIGEPVFNSQGKVIKLRGTLMDIDQYKKHELEISQSLEVTIEQKQQLKNFAYVLSHHIRNHTSNLTALSAMIEVESLDEENKDLILKSRQVTQALSATLDDLAGVIEAQDQTISDEFVSFESVAAHTIKKQLSQIRQAQATIVQNFEVAAVQFPRFYLNNIFQHLLANAIQYKDPAKQLQVEFKSYQDNHKTVLECSDNGLGIDMNLYGHKLFNLHATFHPKVSSRGVGLYLIKTQIESQGGKITVTSEPGTGSIFKVVFK
ncbi:MAG: sensor histidine kinase [Janthinobacterium lividum]